MSDADIDSHDRRSFAYATGSCLLWGTGFGVLATGRMMKPVLLAANLFVPVVGLGIGVIFIGGVLRILADEPLSPFGGGWS